MSAIPLPPGPPAVPFEVQVPPEEYLVAGFLIGLGAYGAYVWVKRNE